MRFVEEFISIRGAILTPIECSAWRAIAAQSKVASFLTDNLIFSLEPQTISELRNQLGILDYDLTWHMYHPGGDSVGQLYPIISFKSDKDYIAAKLLFD
jgi:hypothetical protein